jgi:UDP-N-acetylglucosamine diphosphorylase/glucosamine-1-phosphate N-acetyltransferase
MTNLILFDGDVRAHLLPLTFLRPISEIRVGLLTIREKWELRMNAGASHITEDYLSDRFPLQVGADNLLVNGSALPSEPLCRLLRNMEFGEAYIQEEELLAARLDGEQLQKLINEEEIERLRVLPLHGIPYNKINRITDLFRIHADEIASDFHLVTSGRHSQPISGTNRIVAAERIFIEEGAWVEGATLNASNGPIYIGKNAVVMEGASIRGGLYLGENAVIKMGAQLYGPNTIGPWCKVGGETEQSILLGYSNKAHHGYLGHSVIAEWCNIGAGTTVSNLRNDYRPQKIWNYPLGTFEKTGETFCGLIMGDHSRAGINMMFNSGTSVGVGCNLYGNSFPRNFIPSFSLGGPAGLQTYPIEQSIGAIAAMMQRRSLELSIEERITLIRLFEETAAHRSWGK